MADYFWKILLMYLQRNVFFSIILDKKDEHVKRVPVESDGLYWYGGWVSYVGIILRYHLGVLFVGTI